MGSLARTLEPGRTIDRQTGPLRQRIPIPISIQRGLNMNVDANPLTPSQLTQRTAYEAALAQRATEADAKAKNSTQVAALSVCADAGQQAEHIRGLVAATVSQLSIDCSATTRENAAHWQTWALGLADGLDAPLN